MLYFYALKALGSLAHYQNPSPLHHQRIPRCCPNCHAPKGYTHRLRHPLFALGYSPHYAYRGENPSRSY